LNKTIKNELSRNHFIFFILILIYPLTAYSNIEYHISYKSNYNSISIDYRLKTDRLDKLQENKNLNSLPVPNNHRLVSEPGYPEVPYKNLIFAVPDDSEPNLKITMLESELLGVKEIISPAPQYMKSIEGRTSITRKQDERIYLKNESYPKISCELSELGYFRDLRLVNVKIFPYTWNPLSGFIWINTNIKLEIVFNSDKLLKDSISPEQKFDPFFERLKKSLVLNYPQTLKWNCSLKNGFRDTDSWNPLGMVKIKIMGEGIYRITGKELIDTGIDLGGIDASKLGIYNMGDQVASKISVSQDLFSEDDYIEFYGEAFNSKYTEHNIYWLSFETDSPLRISEFTLSEYDTENSVSTHFPTIRFEENKGYKQVIPNSDKIDHWYWERKIIGEKIITKNLSLTNLADSNYTSTIKVRMLGETDIIAAGGHLVKISVNGVYLGETTWYGVTEHDFVGQFDQGLLVNGDNTFELSLNPGKGDPENPVAPGNLDGINLNWIEFIIERKLVEEDGFLLFSHEDTGETSFKISGFSDDDILLMDITNPSKPVNLTGFQIVENEDKYDLEFSYMIEGKSDFIAISSKGSQKVESINLISENDLKATVPGADYIIITDSEFIDSLSTLVSRHENSGMRVLKVTTEEIYDQFEYGIFTPEGIRNFLRYAYYNYNSPPPSFVLLVGSANFDYKNHVSNAKNYVPPYIVTTTDVGETPTDTLYTSVSGDDDLPDMAIGRIPVKSIEKLETVLNKLEIYAKNDVSEGWNENVLFVSGGGTDFNNTSNGLLESIPGDYNKLKVYTGSSEYKNVTLAREGFIQIVNEGVLLLNYVGHSNVNRWANGLFEPKHVSEIANLDRMSFWVLFDCLNGYFHDPRFECLGNILLNYADGAAIGCLAQSGTGYPSMQIRYGNTFYEFLFEKKMQRIGESILATGISLGSYERFYLEMINSIVYFGDPALPIRNDFGEDSGLSLYLNTDKQEYNPGDYVNITIDYWNIGPDIENVDIYALAMWGDIFYVLPDGNVQPLKSDFVIPSGSFYKFDNIQFDPDNCPSSTSIDLYAVVVESGTLKPVSNITSSNIIVNKTR